MTADLKYSTARRVLQAIALLLIVSFGSSTAMAAESPTEQLQRKTADIKLLHQQLGERQQEAMSIVKAIKGQRDELISEVRVLARSFRYDSYDAARQNGRVYYNIELLRTLLAYIDAFETKIRFYQAGHDRLTYFRQLVEDDIKLTSTLDIYEIDALATQISLVINKYMADAHIIRMDPQPADLNTAEQVWKQISAARQ